MKILAVQLDTQWEDKDANFRRVRELLEATPPSAGDLVLLPELFATGFSMNVARIAEKEGGGIETFLAALAAECQAYVLGGVAVCGPDGRGRNEAIGFGPDGECVVRYQKLHPFSHGGEDKHYEPGSAIAAFPCGPYTAAPLVCYDLRFPEAFRAAVRQGASLFPVIANWPVARAAHWTALLRARAIENQAYVAGVNRCGADPSLQYGGKSIIVNPRGETLAEAGSEECVLAAELDLSVLENFRNTFPALKDMRDWD